MKNINLIFLVSIIITLTSCAPQNYRSSIDNSVMEANAKLASEGSPFRWKQSQKNNDGTHLIQKFMIGRPCESAADQTLKSDVLKNIGVAESKYGGVSSPELIETRCVSVARAPLLVYEVWVIKRGNDKIAYNVSMKSSATGGVDFSIHGPWAKTP
jgi:hypothetical protein